VLQQQIKSVMGEAITLTTTPRKYVEHWLKSRLGTMKKSSYAFYSSTLNCWVWALDDLADRDMNALSTDHLIEWRNAEAKYWWAQILRRTSCSQEWTNDPAGN
jgi:hypothetical protein